LIRCFENGDLRSIWQSPDLPRRGFCHFRQPPKPSHRASANLRSRRGTPFPLCRRRFRATWSPESLLRKDEQFVVAVEVAFRGGLEDPDTAARTYDLRKRT
jgi:hypothetical protein